MQNIQLHRIPGGGNGLSGNVDIPVEPEDQVAKLFLTIGEHCVDRLFTVVGKAGSNWRIAAHKVFDTGLQRFTDGLLSEEGDWSKGNQFETSTEGWYCRYCRGRDRIVCFGCNRTFCAVLSAAGPRSHVSCRAMHTKKW